MTKDKMEKNKKSIKSLIIKSRELFLILLLLSFGHLFSREVYAQEVTTQDQAQQTQAEVIVDNNATVQNNAEQSADTGNNSIQVEPSPSPSVQSDSSSQPSPSPEPTAEPEASPQPSPSAEPSPADTSVENNATVESSVSSTSSSGNNSIFTPAPVETTQAEATPSANLNNQEATDSADITTGNAISVVEVENKINSTEVNSKVVNQTLNIFFSGDVDLASVPYIIAEAVFSQNNQDSQVINVAVFSGQNFAYLSNDIVSLANTGSNSIEGSKQATILTGDAYSVVSLVNQVNTTIVDSIIHIVTINIFGTVAGNIILPEFSNPEACCGSITQSENQANLENNISSSALSGQNSIETAGGGNIETGNINSVVNLVNLVNTNIIGMLFHYLFINNFGSWSGDFLGWDDILASQGGTSLTLTSLQSGGLRDGCSCIQDANIYNQAFVSNNISSTAQTGGNSIDGGNGSIKTGKANSAISILNFINTNIIRSIGFFGFINIFGTLTGDVGGISDFPPDDVEDEEEVVEELVATQDQNPKQNDPSPRETGGNLKVTQSNNVGEVIFPGDTITFFVTVKNTGVGRVYGAKLSISFIKDGVDMGGATFNLGDIDPARGVKLTTGLVLSKDAKPGLYTARAKVWGKVGEDGLVSDFADSTFIVFAPAPILSEKEGFIGEVYAAEAAGVLGGVYKNRGLTMEQKMWTLFITCVATYLMLRGIRERRKVALALYTLRSIFFSHFPPFL